MVHITEGMRNMGREHRLTILLHPEHDLRLLTAVTSGLTWTSLTPCLDVYTASSTDALIQWYMYTMEHYSTIKKNEIMPSAATWMDLEIIILSKSDRENKDQMISLICGI